jgi:ribosomal protein S27AE
MLRSGPGRLRADRPNGLMKRHRTCPDCGGREIFTTVVSAGGGRAPDLLPGAHPWWKGATLEVYICGTCGHFQYYVPDDTLAKVRESTKFQRPR